MKPSKTHKTAQTCEEGGNLVQATRRGIANVNNFFLGQRETEDVGDQVTLVRENCNLTLEGCTYGCKYIHCVTPFLHWSTNKQTQASV
jgi:hypothetical protein